jgi:hypothetical protein
MTQRRAASQKPQSGYQKPVDDAVKASRGFVGVNGRRALADCCATTGPGLYLRSHRNDDNPVPHATVVWPLTSDGLVSCSDVRFRARRRGSCACGFCGSSVGCVGLSACCAWVSLNLRCSFARECADRNWKKRGTRETMRAQEGKEVRLRRCKMARLASNSRP